MDARPITFAAICAAALLTSVAATGVEPADSVVSETKAPVAENDSLFTQLSEFVVEGRTQRVVKYGVEYIPDKRTKKSASDATQLLMQMQIPQLTVMAGSNSVTTVTGKGVTMFIDYRAASEQDLAGLRPQDVVRVEVLQYPQDPRFEGAAYVVNFIMQQYEWGGYTKVTASGSTLNGDSGTLSAYSKLSYKSWTFDVYAGADMSHNDRYRSNRTETFRDVTFQGRNYDVLRRISDTEDYMRLENSEWVGLRAYRNTENSYIQHRAGFFRVRQPHLDVQSRVSMPEAGMDDAVARSGESSQTLAPSVSGYYQFSLPYNTKLSASWSFSYSRNSRNSSYSVGALDPILNSNREDTYSPTVNLSYAKGLGHNNTFRTSLMTYNSIYDTKYGGSYDGRQKLLSSENMIFLEYMQNWQFGLNLYTRVGMSYVVGRVNGTNTLEQWNPRLGAQLQYQINDKHSASIEGWWGNGHPGASEYNDAIVQSNELMWLQGNPDMKNTLFHQATASYTFMPNNHWNLSAYAEYEGNPDKQAYEYYTLPGYDGLVRRMVNSGNFHAYRGWLSTTVRLFNNSLSLQGQVRVQKAVFTGADGGHWTWVNGWVQAVYYLGNFSFVANYITPSREINGYSHGQTVRYKSAYGVALGYGSAGWNINLSYYNWFNRGRIYTDSDSGRYAATGWEWNSQCAPNLNLSVTYTFGYGKKINTNNELRQDGRIDSAILK